MAVTAVTASVVRWGAVRLHEPVAGGIADGRLLALKRGKAHPISGGVDNQPRNLQQPEAKAFQQVCGGCGSGGKAGHDFQSFLNMLRWPQDKRLKTR